MILRLTALLCLLTAEASAAEQRYAVIIGNNLGDEGERPLTFAERDASKLAGVLSRLGSLKPENAVLLLGESAASIRRALLEVNARIRAESADTHSTLIVYYSGHADAEGLHPGPKEAMPYEELRAIMRGSAASVRLLILDACRSGELTKVKGGKPSSEFEIKTEQAPDVEGLVMISSSAAGEDSHESERLGASFFSHHFSNAMVGAGDKNEDGRVTLNEAYAYAYQNTLRASGRTMSLQHPTYAYDLKGRGELVMTRLESDEDRSARLQLAEKGLYLIFEESGGQVVAEVRAPRDQTQLVLPARGYFVQRRAADHYREYAVELPAGAVVRLDQLDHKKVAYARLVRKGDGDRSASHGLYLLANGRGPLLEDMGAGFGATLGYALDLELVSLGLRARFGQTGAAALRDAVSVTHQELALGLFAQYFFDLPIVSVGIGLFAEGIRHQQNFSGDLGDRVGYGLAFGGLFTLEIALFGPVVLRLEGGPVTYLFDRTVVDSGEEVATEIATPLTGFASAGVGWQF